MSQVLVCKHRSHDGLIEIQSPSVGEVKLLVQAGQMLAPHQAIAELFRLGKRFELRLPSEVSGRVKIEGAERLMSLGYGETIVVLEPISSVQSNAKEAVAEHQQAEQFIEAPMDGMFFLSPSPKSPPFVKVGDEIAPGQVIGLVEVMKCFYPLNYQGAQPAIITRIEVSDASPITIGARLYAISSCAKKTIPPLKKGA